MPLLHILAEQKPAPAATKNMSSTEAGITNKSDLLIIRRSSGILHKIRCQALQKNA